VSGAEAGALSPSEPADSDVDLQVPAQRAELRRAPWSVLAVISLGGALGAVARYGIGVAFPVTSPGFPWPTLLINVVGCLLIGVLMVFVTEVWTDRPLARPFLGVGVLGGFTTFSTYVVDIQRLVRADAIGTALAYLGATLVLALVATWLGLVTTRRLVARWART
jgi:CrcB protein